MNTYSKLLPYRLCLLDWNTKYSTPSHSFSWEGCWAQGEGHGNQDVSGREAVRPWDIGLEAVISSSFRTAIIISLEVAMTGPAWGANDLSEKLFLSWQLPKPIVSLLWVSPKRPLMCLREAHNFSQWKLFWNDSDFYATLKSVAFINRLFDLRDSPTNTTNALNKVNCESPGFVLETNKKHPIKLENDIRICVCVHLFIYLAVLGVNCGRQTINFSMWDLFPWWKIKLAHPLHWELGVLATRSQEKSLYGTFFLYSKQLYLFFFVLHLWSYTGLHCFRSQVKP